MARIIKWLPYAFALLALFGSEAHARTINAASCSSSDVQTAIDSALNGDTVVVPSGTCTWSTQVSVANKGITLQGQTTCTGTPPSSCTDNTTINLGVTNGYSLVITGFSVTNFVTVEGFTFNSTGAGGPNGDIEFYGPTWPPPIPGFRLTGNHATVNTGGAGAGFFYTAYAFGLVDHNLFVQSGSGNVAIFVAHGDVHTRGFQSWETPLAFGTNQALYMEDNTFTFAQENTEGPFDGYTGGRIVFRHNQVNNGSLWGTHGTDTGSARSFFSIEAYDNAFSNTQSGTTYIQFYSRGGTALLWGNSYSGVGAFSNTQLQCFRCGSNIAGTGSWGLADGTKWLLGSLDPTASNGETNSTNGPDWTASTGYANLAAILPLTNNAGSFNFTAQGACTSGSTRPSFNETIGGTTTDNTCTWLNEGGGAAGIGAHWCAINRDIPATSDSMCASITSGDTASTFFDGSGPGGYPARDQIGRTHNQALAPFYEWLNSPNPGVNGYAGSSGDVQANRDYYVYTTSFSGTSGVGSGTLVSRPSTCTPYVAYWATDTNTLYQCTATNTWTAYYHPYTYPYQLTLGSGTPPAPPTNLTAVVH